MQDNNMNGKNSKGSGHVGEGDTMQEVVVGLEDQVERGVDLLVFVRLVEFVNSGLIQMPQKQD